ncbi:MAG: DsrE family protein [Thiotrichales bacterium]|nr:DsrE family protein [Thiotrichales bacterium]
MLNKSLAIIGLCSVFALPLVSSSVLANELEQVAYHVDFAEADRFSATLTSVNNMLIEYENALSEYDLSIVFVGLGARFVTDSAKAGTDARLNERRKELHDRLLNLQRTKGVKLAVCANTLKDFGLSEADLYPGVETVPSGVVHLAKLQKEGSAYLKIQ